MAGLIFALNQLDDLSKLAFPIPLVFRSPISMKFISILLFVALQPIIYCVREEGALVTPIRAPSGEKESLQN
jgi:hypothetical protein